MTTITDPAPLAVQASPRISMELTMQWLSTLIAAGLVAPAEPRAQALAWHSALHDLEQADVSQAVMKLLKTRTSKTWTVPGDIRTLALDLANSRNRTWRPGYGLSVQPSRPTGHSNRLAAIERLAGSGGDDSEYLQALLADTRKRQAAAAQHAAQRAASAKAKGFLQGQAVQSPENGVQRRSEPDTVVTGGVLPTGACGDDARINTDGPAGPPTKPTER